MRCLDHLGERGRLRRVTTADAINQYATWSPDGTYIAFHSNRGGTYNIWVIPASGGEAVQLTSGPYDDVTPAWSPDGNGIAFTFNRSGNQDIWVLESLP